MKRKGILAITAAVVLTAVFGAGAAASDGLKTVAARLFPNAAARVDGVAKPLAPPLLYRDKIYVQLESLEKALGMEMTWDSEENRLIVSTNRPVTPPSAGQPGTPPPSGGSPVVSEMRFATIVKYEATYKNRVYPILANEYRDTIYFRLRDVAAMGIDLRGIETVEEKHTKEQYVAVHQLADAWDTMPFFKLLKEPVVNGYITSSQMNALNAYAQDAHAITVISPNEFQVLREYDKQFYVNTVTLKELSTPNGTHWYVSSVKYQSISYD